MYKLLYIEEGIYVDYKKYRSELEKYFDEDSPAK